MRRYSVTMYVHRSFNDSKGKATTIQVPAKDREEAEERAIDNCEAAGVIHGNIISVIEVRA